MPEVGAAAAADRLGSLHAVALVHFFLHDAGLGGVVKARPARAGIILFVGLKKLQPAGAAEVGAVLVVVPIGVLEGRFRAALAHDAVLLRGHLLAPFLVAL